MESAIAEPPERRLEDIGDLGLNIVLSKLEAKDIAAVTCVSKRFRDSASDDSLWFSLCSRELDLSAPLDSLGNSTTSFKETYKLWREAFGMYPWPLVKRVKKCWGQLENWLAINFPEAVGTLQRGASEASIEALEKTLKIKLPISTRILYRFHDGQKFTVEEVLKKDGPISMPGLIGGYRFYDHFVHVYLLPIRHIIIETKKVTRQLGFSMRSKYIVVAASTTISQKLFFLNCTDGQLSVGTRNVITDGEMIPCVPKPLISQAQDAMLLWLEEHGSRLQNGIIKLQKEGNVRYINLYPEESPSCSTAVTNGVQVRASAVFVPEMSDLEHVSLFSYSIRMRLLPEGCIVEGMSFGSCQLRSRHWIIRTDHHVKPDVHGEGVIGKFPLLFPGGEEFVYESCSPMPSFTGSIEGSFTGSIEGSFTFVPGSMADPKGREIEVDVARFPLQLPEYIF